MPAAPASNAAPPRPASRGSLNPAVPPPPVAGAPVGSAPADCVGAADVAGADVAGADAGPGDTLAPAAGDLLAAPLDGAPEVGEADGAGENEVGPPDGVDPEQAETAAETNKVKVAQPMTASRGLSPVPEPGERAVMGPPAAAGRYPARFRTPGTRNRLPRAGSCPGTRPVPLPARPRYGSSARWRRRREAQRLGAQRR